MALWDAKSKKQATTHHTLQKKRKQHKTENDTNH
jgi:hypothetical protein